MPARTVSNPQPSPPCSLITARASLSSRNPANLECRRWFDLRFILHLWREPPSKYVLERRGHDGLVGSSAAQVFVMPPGE